MIDSVSMILLIVGGILLFLSIIKSFGNKSTLVGVVGFVVLIFGILGFMNAIDYSAFGAGVPVQRQFTQTVNVPAQAAPSSCSANAITSNGKSQADILYRNVENASLAYVAASVSANSAGQLIDSGTTNAGASASYVSLSNIPNCNTGELIATVTTGIGAAPSRKLYDVEKGVVVTQYDFSDKAVHKYEIRGSNYDVVSMLGRSTSFAEASSGLTNASLGDEWLAQTDPSVSGTGTADGNVYFTNTTLGAKGSLNFYIDMKVNGTSAVTGAYEEPDGIVLSYDSVTASKFSPSSMSLQSDTAGWSLSKVPCPQDVVNNRNSEACWFAPSMKAGILYRIKGTLTADLGDPGVADTPKLAVDDRVFFRDTDSTIKYGSFSTSGTNQGVGATIMNFLVS